MTHRDLDMADVHTDAMRDPSLDRPCDTPDCDGSCPLTHEEPTYADPFGIRWAFTDYGPTGPLMAYGLPNDESLNEDYASHIADDASTVEQTPALLETAVRRFYETYGDDAEKEWARGPEIGLATTDDLIGTMRVSDLLAALAIAAEQLDVKGDEEAEGYGFFNAEEAWQTRARLNEAIATVEATRA